MSWPSSDCVVADRDVEAAVETVAGLVVDIAAKVVVGIAFGVVAGTVPVLVVEVAQKSHSRGPAHSQEYFGMAAVSLDIDSEVGLMSNSRMRYSHEALSQKCNWCGAGHKVAAVGLQLAHQEFVHNNYEVREGNSMVDSNLCLTCFVEKEVELVGVAVLQELVPKSESVLEFSMTSYCSPPRYVPEDLKTPYQK